MSRTAVLKICAFLALATVADAQEPHPAKQDFASVAEWPATAPGAMRLANFRPFRAVYDREYSQGSGPNAGDKRKDRVIVHAEQVGWEGRRAASISVIDSGIAEHADTLMRALTMVIDLENLGVLFEMGPLPGAAKDYYIGLFMGDEARVSIVRTEAQELTRQKSPMNGPGFGAGTWAMAVMDLKPGLRIRLAPYYSPKANSASRTDYGRVLEQKQITDGSGKKHNAWVIETGGWYGPDSPKTLRLYVKDSPPYHLGTEIYNHDDGETKRFMWLRDFQSMGG